MSLVLTPLQSLAGELDWSSSLLGVAEESRRLKMYVPGSFYFYCFLSIMLNFVLRLFGGAVLQLLYTLDNVLGSGPSIIIITQTFYFRVLCSYFKYGLDAFNMLTLMFVLTKITPSFGEWLLEETWI